MATIDDMRNRAQDWYRQAERDARSARSLVTAAGYDSGCFLAQQSGEKALKAVALFRGYEDVRSHSILRICQALDIDGEIEEMGKKLDQYYISSRYPDAFEEGAPFEYFTKAQAEEAVGFAARIIEIVGQELKYTA